MSDSCLAASLEQGDCTVTHLDLSERMLDGEGVARVAAALAKNTTVTVLDISDNGIGDEGAAHFAAALERNRTLVAVDFSDNQIGDEGAAAIFAALEGNSMVTALGLSSNRIGDSGVCRLAKTLGRNAALSTIDLGSNVIREEGAKRLAAALEEDNSTVTVLDVAGNTFSYELVGRLTAALVRNRVGPTLVLLLDITEDNEGRCVVARNIAGEELARVFMDPAQARLEDIRNELAARTEHSAAGLHLLSAEGAILRGDTRTLLECMRCGLSACSS
eukprot:TRINITY_DN16102_c0_g1_i1.p1 TRINITY_DN16102_c0_g1~~TRINITY_DN16102_c0_g1_i1.p1  ORF type:complete len:275 (-),score=50.22 TRINITY_DN16102_c0_g1_i1:42-866(-)